MTATMVRVGLTTALLYTARRFYRNWGTTKDECSTPLPGDELVGLPAQVTTEGISIDAPPSAVWPWLVQIGQDRGGLYGYQGLQNRVGLDYHNADQIHPEWQHVASGDTVRLAPKGWLGLPNGIVVTVVDVIAGQSIVLRTAGSDNPWDAVWSLNVIQHWDDRCRLLIRTRVPLRHPGAVLAAELAGPAKALMTRAILLGIKRRVECEAQAEAAATAASNARHPAV